MFELDGKFCQRSVFPISIFFENRSSVPISIHDIRKLNEEFATLHERYSKEELEEIIKEKN